MEPINCKQKKRVTVECVQDAIEAMKDTGMRSGYIKISRSDYGELIEDMRSKGYTNFNSLDGFRFEVI